MASSNTLARKDEGDGDERDEYVGKKHERSNKARQTVFMTKKFDLMVHFEEDAKAILNEGGDEKEATCEGEVGRDCFAGLTHGC